MFFSNSIIKHNIMLKELLLKPVHYRILEKIVISVSILNINKLNNYIVLQSICLLDTICNQKPSLYISKYRYNLGLKTLNYSCKVTLRSYNMVIFLDLFNIIYLSEMKRRYMLSNFQLTSLNHFTFSLKTTNIFTKLDSFYYQWNQSILLNFIFNLKLLNNYIFYFLNFNFSKQKIITK